MSDDAWMGLWVLAAWLAMVISRRWRRRLWFKIMGPNPGSFRK